MKKNSTNIIHIYLDKNNLLKCDINIKYNKYEILGILEYWKNIIMNGQYKVNNFQPLPERKWL